MKNKAYDYLIVGAGLYGATFAHIARQRDKKCLVIDRRANVGGNVYCECVEGINVHKYGAHIFHTNNKEVWNFVNGIVPFNRYPNSPIARYKDKMFNLPFNMNTFHEMWADVYTPQDAQRRIEEQKQDALAKIKGEGRTEAANLEEQAQLLIGKDIYEALIKGYTEKQWGRRCSDLPPFIIKRLPVRMVFDNNYFNALYQGIPCGGIISYLSAYDEHGYGVKPSSHHSCQGVGPSGACCDTYSSYPVIYPGICFRCDGAGLLMVVVCDLQAFLVS